MVNILSKYTFHKPDSDGITKMRNIRRKCRELAELIEANCPDSDEKKTAFTQLQFVMMSANSSIVQEYPIDEKDF
jgi:hypothetical protein